MEEAVIEPQLPQHVVNPPAIVVQVKDEQALKREWDEACADEQDAVERKAAVLREALKRWPMVLSSNPGQRARGMLVHSPEMRRFVRDVIGMPDQKRGGLNSDANKLIKLGAAGLRAVSKKSQEKTQSRRRQIERAVVELTTKYRLGADPTACMEDLCKFYEEQPRGQE
jgi:hypothetical protein